MVRRRRRTPRPMDPLPSRRRPGSSNRRPRFHALDASSWKLLRWKTIGERIRWMDRCGTRSWPRPAAIRHRQPPPRSFAKTLLRWYCTVRGLRDSRTSRRAPISSGYQFITA